jgi:signal transduction histidine kinase
VDGPKEARLAPGDNFGEQLDSLRSLSAEITLSELDRIYDRALGYSLELTHSQHAFIGLLTEGMRELDVAAVKGFVPSSPEFYETFRLMAVRASVVGVVIQEQRSHISNDVSTDPYSVGQPPGHPPIRKFLGVPLRVGTSLIGMLGVANKLEDYTQNDERLLSTFANWVAVAIDNARLNQSQSEMIVRLKQLRKRLTDAEREQLLARDRARIAGHLHDRIGQDIFTLGLGLDSLLESENLDPTLSDFLRVLRDTSVNVAHEMRNVVFALGAGHQGDLRSSVRSLLADVERTAGLRAHLIVHGSPTGASAGVQDVLYLVVKEALNNVVKHAQARRVLVYLRFEDGHVDVVIQDDGVGAPEPVLLSFPHEEMHFGLRHMREQVLDLGGSFDVAQGEECGLVVRVGVPLTERPA